MRLSSVWRFVMQDTLENIEFAPSASDHEGMDTQTFDYTAYVTQAAYWITGICVFGGMAAFATTFLDMREVAKFPPLFSRIGLVVAIVALGFSWEEITEYHEVGKAAIGELKVDSAQHDLMMVYLQMGTPGGDAAITDAEKRYRETIDEMRSELQR